jgi:hypothetical protein
MSKPTKKDVSGRYPGPSMGAAVMESPCPICERTGPHTHRGQAVIQDGVVYGDLLPGSFSVSIVKAPRCGMCIEPMAYRGGTTWACQTDICTAFGREVETSIGGVMGQLGS